LVVEPVRRIALTQQEACASLGCCEEFFVEHVRPRMRVARRGRRRLFPADEVVKAHTAADGFRLKSNRGFQGNGARADDPDVVRWRPAAETRGRDRATDAQYQQHHNGDPHHPRAGSLDELTPSDLPDSASCAHAETASRNNSASVG
jgi:hypothetical protein